MKKMNAFITGATSGIGLATAHQLAPFCETLIINGRRQDRLEKLKSELSGLCQVQIALFDIRDRKEVETWFSQQSEIVKKLDVLINNAGLARGTDPLQSGALEDWDEMIDTNVKGLLFVTRQVLPLMIAQKRGHIVNIGSVAGRWSYPGGGVYCATKFSVRALSECLRMDLMGTGLRVTNIEPGMVDTEFSEVRFRDKTRAQQVYKNMTPLTAQDIAETIVWSLQRPAHVNIQEMVVFPTDQASLRDVHRTR